MSPEDKTERDALQWESRLKKALATAERAHAAGRFDTARRAVVYLLSATGLRARLNRAPSADPEALALYLRALRAEVARRAIENQAARTLFAGVR